MNNLPIIRHFKRADSHKTQQHISACSYGLIICASKVLGFLLILLALTVGLILGSAFAAFFGGPIVFPILISIAIVLAILIIVLLIYSICNSGSCSI